MGDCNMNYTPCLFASSEKGGSNVTPLACVSQNSIRLDGEQIAHIMAQAPGSFRRGSCEIACYSLITKVSMGRIFLLQKKQGRRRIGYADPFWSTKKTKSPTRELV